MATAKQIAARKRFAQMAKSGELARKRKSATKRAKNPSPRSAAARSYRESARPASENAAIDSARAYWATQTVSTPTSRSVQRPRRNPVESLLPYLIVAPGHRAVLASARTAGDAKIIAQALADHYKMALGVTK